MKHTSFAFLILAVALGCTLSKRHYPDPHSGEVPPKPMITPIEATVTPSESTPIFKPYKAPKYKFVLYKGQMFDLSKYHEAIALIEKHANSDGFYQYVVSKRTYYSHTNNMKVTDAIKKFREQLNQEENIEVVFYTPFRKGKAIGGWDGIRINENSKFYMDAISRAGHLLHETSHKYGWVHQGNYTNENDNVNSFPYAIGYDFQDYLESLNKTQLAGE